MRTSTLISALFIATFVTECTEGPDLPGDAVLKPSGVKWSESDNPSQFPFPYPMNLVFDELPTHGRAHNAPWPGSSWETALDSINYRWNSQQQQSAVEKYAAVYGEKNLEDVVSTLYGVDQFRGGSTCRSDDDCKRTEQCGKRRGESAGYCIPRWWGLCHAWSLASIAEPEPKRAVTVDGVRFEINDIKALMTLAYDRSNLYFVSQRCELSGNSNDMVLDEHGRPQSECMDTNPGAFHVFLANMVGIQGLSFAADVVYDYEVSNMPIYSYRVLNSNSISRQKAVSLVGDVFNKDAVTFQLVETEVDYVLSSASDENGVLSEQIGEYLKSYDYRYILEINKSNKIIGGEWVQESKTDHPDFLRFPQGPSTAKIAAGHMTYSRIKQLLNAAQDDSDVELSIDKHTNTARSGQSRTFGPYEVGTSGFLDASIKSEGNVELFVHRTRSVSTREYSCRRRWAQTSDPCVVKGPGTFYVTVLGHSWETAYDLTVLYGKKR